MIKITAKVSIKDYFEVIRLYRIYNSLVPIVIHIFLIINFNIHDTRLFLNIFYYLIVISYFLYGGIYTLNGIADIEEDKKIPYKSKRPIPSGKINILEAYIIAFSHIIFSLIISAILGRLYLYISTIFLLINILYTYVLKKINRIISSIFITSTWIIRMLIPFIILSSDYPGIEFLLLNSYLLGCTMHFMLQRRMEKNLLSINKFTFLINVSMYLSILISISATIFYKDVIHIVPFALLNLFFIFRDRNFLKSMYVAPKNFEEQLERGDK